MHTPEMLRRRHGSADARLTSVVLPTFNRAALLGRAIESVLGQSQRDLELIVVDDGSTDGTADVVGRFADQRIRYLRQPANRGQAAARNEGVRHARGALLAFQDSDDVWLPSKLERFLAAFASADAAVGVVYSDMTRVWLDGRAEYHRSPSVVRGRLLDSPACFYQVAGLGIQATVIRRWCFERAGGFNERLRCFEDLDLFIRLSRRHDFVHIEAPLTEYHQTAGSVSEISAHECRARQWLLLRYGLALAIESPHFVRRELRHVRECRRECVPRVSP